MRRVAAAGAVLLAAGNAAPVCALPPSPAHWSVERLPKQPLAPGAVVTLALKATIDSGWHLYALEEPEGGPIATEIGMQQGDPMTLLDVSEPEPRKVPDAFTHVPSGMFQGNVVFTLKLRTPQSPVAPDASSRIAVRYQACNDHVCLPPRTDFVTVPLAGIVRLQAPR